jgi:hypothetical protein
MQNEVLIHKFTKYNKGLILEVVGFDPTETLRYNSSPEINGKFHIELYGR